MPGQPFEEAVKTVREFDERERMRRSRTFSMALAEASGAKDEILAQGKREAEFHILLHLFERKLKRPLDESELASLQEKLAQLGVHSVSDIVVELSTKKLSAWLLDPSAQEPV